MSDNLTGGFKSFGEFCIAVRKFYAGERQDSRIKTAMTEGTDSTGSVLVPEQYASEIRLAALESAIVRPRAIVYPMTGDTENIPVLIDSTRASAMFGGVTMTWIAEEGDRATGATAPALGRVKLRVKDGVISAWGQNQLEADAPAFGAFLSASFGRALSYYEDYVFLTGTGSGQPLGVKNANCRIQVARESNVHVTAKDLALMAERLLPGSWGSAVWCVNQSIISDWLRYGVDTGIHDFVDLVGMTILGCPIIITEKCAAIGSEMDILLADFSHYVIGDRALVMAASRETTYSSATYGWLQNQTCFTLTTRVDGQPIIPAAITAHHAASGKTVSPFVTLSAQTS